MKLINIIMALMLSLIALGYVVTFIFIDINVFSKNSELHVFIFTGSFFGSITFFALYMAEERLQELNKLQNERFLFKGDSTS